MSYLWALFIPPSVTIHIFHCRNINVFNYRVLPQSLMGVLCTKRCAHCVTFLTRERKIISISRHIWSPGIATRAWGPGVAQSSQRTVPACRPGAPEFSPAVPTAMLGGRRHSCYPQLSGEETEAAKRIRNQPRPRANGSQSWTQAQAL